MNSYLSVLKKYFVFSGRAGRREFWIFVLFNGIFAMIALILDNVLGTDIEGFNFGILYSLVFLAVFIPTLSVAVRRLHDTGKNGWLVLIFFVPVIGSIWLLVLLAMEGFPGKNQYGLSPNYTGVQEYDTENEEMAYFDYDTTTEDTIILIVVVWMVFSRLFWAIAPKLTSGQFTPQWFETVNTVIGIMWAFVPFGLSFAVKSKSKQVALFILGGVYLFYSLFDVVFDLFGK